MYTSHLWIEGRDYQAKGAARRLGLGRQFYSLKGVPIEFGPRKGTPTSTSILRIPLSDHLNYERHMRQIEIRLGQLMTFLSTERLRYGNGVNIHLAVGMTVGGEKYFTRSFCALPTLMSFLVALEIHLSVNAYPCSDSTERNRLKWSDGVGRMPGLDGYRHRHRMFSDKPAKQKKAEIRAGTGTHSAL